MIFTRALTIRNSYIENHHNKENGVEKFNEECLRLAETALRNIKWKNKSNAQTVQ